MIVFSENNPDGFELLKLRPISVGSPKSRATLRTPDGRELTAFAAAGAIHALYEKRERPGSPDMTLEVLATYQRHLYAKLAGDTIVLLTQGERDQLERGELSLAAD